MEKELDRKTVVNMIINEDYLDFHEDLNKKNNYLIHFPSDKPNYDIAIAITAQNNKIIVMTVYEKRKNKYKIRDNIINKKLSWLKFLN